MPMRMLIILQTLVIFGVYSLLTVALPALIFGKKLAGRRYGERLLFYFLFGNFYIINLVFVLELMKISYRSTLFMGTFIPAFFAWVHNNNIPVRQVWQRFLVMVRRATGGQLGFKSGVLHLLAGIQSGIKTLLKFIWSIVKYRIAEFVWIAVIVAAAVYLYGTQHLYDYGYGVSDLPVHNYWINYLSYNQIFVAGVYPFGFHCLIYYLHMLTGIDTFVFLRLFGITQTVYIFLVLAGFLRMCCKTKYLAYAGTLAVILYNGFNYGTYFRYATTLPQEFGMLFIFPGIYFLYRFFEERRTEVKEKKKDTGSLFCLLAFGISFSLTLAVHFYDTMIAGLCCIGVAVGYCWILFRKQYFGRILLTGVLAVFAAVLPMGIAFATGTPLQGSLGWGLSIIQGTDKEETGGLPESAGSTGSAGTTGSTGTTGDADTSGSTGTAGSAGSTGSTGTTDSTGTTGGTDTSGNAGTSGGTGTTEGAQAENTGTSGMDAAGTSAGGAQTGTGTALDGTAGVQAAEAAEEEAEPFYRFYYRSAYEIMRRDVLARGYDWMVRLFFLAGAALFLAGALFFALRRPLYASMLVSTGVYLFLMITLLISARLKIPEIMNVARGMIYFVYSLPVVFVFLADAVCYLLLIITRMSSATQALSLALATASVCTIAFRGQVKDIVIITPLETNSAIVCITNIFEKEKDFTWTIFSANDERSIGLDHGYHYELITFLRRMEHYRTETAIDVPTEKLFFFVEKVPLAYTVNYDGLGQSISEEGAANRLPHSGGIQPYQGRNRWVVMSRTYYWAEEFRKIYPNEMSVYYETDDFICYQLKQNPYRLYNLAIDYGYNSTDWNAVQMGK